MRTTGAAVRFYFNVPKLGAQEGVFNYGSANPELREFDSSSESLNIGVAYDHVLRHIIAKHQSDIRFRARSVTSHNESVKEHVG